MDLSKPEANTLSWPNRRLRRLIGVMTRLRRAIGFAVLAAAMIGVSSRPVSACTCIASGPPCQTYFQVDAVFVGTVRAIEVREVPIEGITWLARRRLVHISIDGPARGVQGTAVDVWTGEGDGDCGYAFKPGSRYIVYAYKRPDGALGTGICSRTRPIEDAGEDLSFIAGLGTRSSGAHVSGRINHWRPIQRPAVIWNTAASPTCRYSFEDPPGRFRRRPMRKVATR